MAPSNRDRVGRAFELLAAGLAPWLDRRMKTHSPLGERWLVDWRERDRSPVSLHDPSFQLKVLCEAWDVAFRHELTCSDRNVAFELRDTRNRWAHNSSFSADDAYRALDSIERLLAAVDAPQSSEVGRAKEELMRLRYDAVARKAAPSPEALAAGPVAGLAPWREVVVPHDDVARGRYALAEFAADLHQVSLGQGAAEYVDPVEFFSRTFLTEGLGALLGEALRRLAGAGGVPVVDLQTTFGGGKTHSQIALWHLFGATALHDFPQDVQDLVAAAGTEKLPAVRRAALVGTKLSPGQPETKADATVVATLWGELAWQLGGAEGYAMVADADRLATSPGDHLRAVLERYAPCLVLVDEWVAYARQLVGADGLPGGSFDTQFSFAQALTEATRAVPGAMLVVSLPASEAARPGGDGGQRRSGSDVEVGGPGGREALARLRAVVGRMESSWRPASATESFEIVRRRLFRPIEPDALARRDATARAFGELYRREASEFPAECREPAYTERIKAAFPIHPELFARLYEDWSTLERFQRTRGVLRLMAGVIHALWEAGDPAPLIMAASVPLADTAVSSELTRNLEDAWKPVIDADIDGPASLPVALDRELAGTLGRFHAARRVARAVFLASAPRVHSPNRGVDAARVRLACVLPGEAIATFGDALARLSGRATYLYADAGRYWFALSPSVARLARDRAERLLAEGADDIAAYIAALLAEEGKQRGPFAGVHPAPAGPGDVPDSAEVRLVILNADQPHLAKSEASTALGAARRILERRGPAARDYRNMVVFLAADSRRLDELTRGVAEHLAWRSVHDQAGADGLDLDPAQARQAATKAAESARTAGLRLAETYQWLLVPTQADPLGPVAFDSVRVEGQEPLAVRAGRKLISAAYLYVTFAPVLLRQQLDGPLAAVWADGHASAGAIWDAFARYPYLPRLASESVLLQSIADGPALTTWASDTFAVADAVDAATGRYLGLVAGGHAAVGPAALVVRPERAAAQLAQDQSAGPPPGAPGPSPAGAAGSSRTGVPTGAAGASPAPAGPVRFHASVTLDPSRISRDFGRVAQEVIDHLSAHLGTRVEVTVDVAAVNAEGFPDHVVRVVTENARTLRFDDAGFEER